MHTAHFSTLHYLPHVGPRSCRIGPFVSWSDGTQAHKAPKPGFRSIRFSFFAYVSTGSYRTWLQLDSFPSTSQAIGWKDEVFCTSHWLWRLSPQWPYGVERDVKPCYTITVTLNYLLDSSEMDWRHICLLRVRRFWHVAL